MNVEIVEGQVYTTASGERLKVTAHYDHADEIFGIAYKDDGTIAAFFKTGYDEFCLALRR